MNCTVIIDWKFVLALGAFVLVVKMDAPAAERLSTHAVDACKAYAIARISNS